MLKERDEAWNKVESLATRHPSYSSVKCAAPNNNNPFIMQNNENNAQLDEDGESEQALTAEKIEAQANEVSLQNVSGHTSFRLYVIRKAQRELRAILTLYRSV